MKKQQTMKLITFFLLIISITCNAQLKKDLPVYGLMFGAGLAYGQAEKITWHDPYSRSTFWNPYESDHKYFMNLNGYHIMRGLQDGCVVGAIVLSVNDFKGKNKGWQIVKKIAFCSVSFYAGQMITYKIIN